MKKIANAILMISFFSKGFCNSCIITGEIKGNQDSLSIIEKPIMGFFNNVSFEKSDTIKIYNKQFIAKINCRQAVFITIFIDQLPIRLIIQPSDSIHFILDLSIKDEKNKVPITITGANAKGQQLFYEYNYWPREKYENIWKVLKDNEILIVSGVQNEINNQVDPFRNLYLQKQVDKKYYELISSTITSLLLFESIRKILDPNIADIKFSFLTRKKIVDSLFMICNPKKAELQYGLNSILYTKIFLDYKLAQVLDINGFYSFPVISVNHGNKKFKISGDFSSLLYESNYKSREILFGSQLLSYLKIGGGDEILKDEIEYFKTTYSSSPYIQIISSYKKISEQKKAGLKKARVFDLTPITIIDSSNITKDLQFNQFDFLKNSIVFIDIWATWCGPCLQEMQYNYEIDSLLFVHNIKRLYISIDDKSQKNKWKTIINNMHLGGYHVLAGKELQKFLTREFGIGNNLMAIPHYFIINSGKIIIPEAFRPSEYDKLKSQLLQINNNNKLKASQ